MDPEWALVHLASQSSLEISVCMLSFQALSLYVEFSLENDINKL